MSVMQTPGADGRFGQFGGQYVPETLVPACQELERAFAEAWNDALFREELNHLLKTYAGRPSILTECHNLGRESHRLTQDQQCSGSGTAGQAHGKKAHRC
jgi:tryptophan synthase beta chain